MPPDAGVGTAPDERPERDPGGPGLVAEIKSTTNINTGYDATWRGTILKTERKGLAE